MVAVAPVSSLLMVLLFCSWFGPATFSWPRRRDALLAGGAVTPVDNLGFVDDEPVVLGGLQAWPMPYRAIYVCRATTGPANDVVVIVIHPVLVPGR